MADIFDERLVLNNNAKEHIIYNEHLVRYELAKWFVKDKKVLEIACGSGYGAKILAQAGAAKVIAIDISRSAIESAKHKYASHNIEFIVGNAEDIKQKDNYFDILVSFETIEHLQNQKRFLFEAARVVKPNGIALISTPNRGASQGKNPYHIKEYGYSEFEKEIKNHFHFCHVFKQGNGIASFITTIQPDSIMLQNSHDGAKKGVTVITSQPSPLYFIAVCSQEEIIPRLPAKIYTSINSAALQNLYNNPALRLADKIYSIAVKIPGMKRVIKVLKRGNKAKHGNKVF